MFKLIVVTTLIALTCADHINKNAQIKSIRNEVNEDGSYQYSFDTTNGINIQESGVGGQGSNGNAQWISPEGIPVQLSWVADANGYHPQGSHIPTPPPVPSHVLRALEWIRLHPSPEELQRQQQQILG